MNGCMSWPGTKPLAVMRSPLGAVWTSEAISGCELLLLPYDGFRAEMTSSILQEPKMLEELTGLAAMHAAAELADFDMDVSDGSEDGDEWTTL